jgi:predicted PurR-regulated permease PerM
MQARNKFLLIFLLIALLAAAAWFLSTILIYLFLALVLSLIGSPVNKFLRKFHMGRLHISAGISAFLSLLFIYALLAGLIALFIPIALSEAHIIANTDPQKLIASLHEPISRIDFSINKYWPQSFSTEQYLQSKLPAILNMSMLSNFANSFIGFTGGIFVAFFSVSFFTFFFLKDGRLITETLILISPEQREQDVREVLHNSRMLLTKYFTGLCLDSFLVACIVTIGMTLAGVPNALIIGLFAGIVNIIPYVGVLIAGGFGLLVALSTGLSPDFHDQLFPMITKVLLVFAGSNLIDSLFFQPLIFSNTVKAHPLEIFLVVMITGTLGGIGPMILAVPAYTVLRVIAKQFWSRFRFIKRLTASLQEDHPRRPFFKFRKP